MLERFNQLSFVIGLFFVLVSLILVGGYLFTEKLAHTINLYTGLGMFIFGVFMIRTKA